MSVAVTWHWQISRIADSALAAHGFCQCAYLIVGASQEQFVDEDLNDE